MTVKIQMKIKMCGYWEGVGGWVQKGTQIQMADNSN